MTTAGDLPTTRNYEGLVTWIDPHTDRVMNARPYAIERVGGLVVLHLDGYAGFRLRPEWEVRVQK